MASSQNGRITFLLLIPPISTMPTKFRSRSSSPSSSTAHHEPGESLLSRTILVPILFVSFIFSLLLVDRRTSTSILSPRSSPPGSPNSTGRGKDTHGYYHSHQRKLARSEIDEAFAIRRRVIVAMCGLACVGFLGTVMVGLKIWGWVNG